MSQTQQDGLGTSGYQCSNVMFHALDTIVGVLVVIDSILLLTHINSFVGFFLPVYFVVFGFIIILFVFYAPPQLYASLYFYSFFLGRGLTFLFIGTVMLTFGDDFSIATGVITIILSFIYLVFSVWTKFCNLGCSLPAPLAQRQNGVPPPKESTQGTQPTQPTRSPPTNKSQQTPSSDNNSSEQLEPAAVTPPPNNNTTETNVTVNVNIDQQQYGSAYDNDVAAEQKEPQYSPIAANNSGPQLVQQNGNDLNSEITAAINSEITAAFGKDLNSMKKQTVPGYESDIPTVLVMLEQKLNDNGGYEKEGIFDPNTIASNKDKDEAYLMSNNIIAFFSEMPSPLLSFVDKKVFDNGVSKDAMWRVLEAIDVEHGAVTRFVWDMLAKVAKNECINTSMNSEQLGRIFGPLMTMSKQDMNNDMLTASKMIVCWRRGIDWRMDKL